MFCLRRASRRGRPLQNAVTEMHPRTPTERSWTLAMAVTAGVCEEVVYRRFLIAIDVLALVVIPVFTGRPDKRLVEEGS